MVIIADFGQRQKSALDAIKYDRSSENFTDALFIVVFHNLEPKNAGLVDV